MVLLILAALLVLPLIAGLCYGENVLNFAVTIAAAAALGGIFMLFKPKNRDIYAREGFTAVGLSWILMSLIGALPFVISGDIPNFADAVFESCSGGTMRLTLPLNSAEYWLMQTNLTGKYPRLRSNCGKSLSMKQRVSWRALSGRKLKKIMLSFSLIFAIGAPFSVITHGLMNSSVTPFWYDVLTASSASENMSPSP